MKKKQSKFDIRCKETLTLFLREYSELFFPDIAGKIKFETAKFLDRELTRLNFCLIKVQKTDGEIK
ncbi:MAG: hypothetical protein GY795_34840 [Desulfobacterales bacterium]|nr:hypothetical protein [Desulfobacterales bacterium]